MAIEYYNTLTRKKEKFVPIKKDKVSFYACGPTVYAPAHIGNFRTFVFEDLLHRHLTYQGFNVELIMNITDVDDKTIKASIEQKVSLKDYTQKYSSIFLNDLEKLNIKKATNYPYATEHIQPMIDLVEVLLEKKFAYIGEDKSVYFSIRKFADYGKFANIDISSLKPGARVNNDSYTKDNVSDFVLWKAYDEADGNVFWQTSFGKGRPGWHLECSAMSMQYLGKTIDIHAGGVDLIFPHHQNEIAQSECSTNQKFCNYWLHSEHLKVDGAKMSKSLGNFYTLDDIINKGYNVNSLRLFLLSAHYRQSLNFTFVGLDSMEKTLNGLVETYRTLKLMITNQFNSQTKLNEVSDDSSFEKLCLSNLNGFINSLDDDLNTPQAFSYLFLLEKEINKGISSNSLSINNLRTAKDTLEKMDSILQVIIPTFNEREKTIDKLSSFANSMIEKRKLAKQEGNYQLADSIRKELLEKGIILEDVGGNTIWKLTSNN